MKEYLSLIKFSHTIFALPFALVGFCLGTLQDDQSFSWYKLLLVLLCMVFARSAAMAFNRYLDRDIDEKNPRTINREIPAGKISPRSALAFVIINSALFITTTFFINRLCFFLSPIALAVILGYSYTKRFTYFCHFVLGLGLSLAPIGAYLAVTGEFNLLPVLYSIVVLLWVTGFDVIYALQDDDFDRSLNLNSIPVKMGRSNALHFSTFLHFVAALILVYAGYQLSASQNQFYVLHWIGTAIFIALLIYQHTLVKPQDLSKVNLAFFTTNGIASIVFGALLILDAFV